MFCEMSTLRAAASETAGTFVGWLLAPVTGAISGIRRARMFHPDGVVYGARVEALAGTPWGAVAARLAGPALVRLSTAWWRGGRELPDALGVAIRFRGTDEPSAEPAPGDQDLLLATIRHPWTLPFAPLTTHVHDFLDNDYYGVSPFAVDGAGLVYLRAVASRTNAGGDNRGERLARAVADGSAWLRLEARERGRTGWQPIAEIHLIAPVAIDQQALRFWPFRNARGLTPRGFVHALRRGTYLASQRVRALTSPASRPSLAHPLASIAIFTRTAAHVIRPRHADVDSDRGGNGERRLRDQRRH
jgi:hypothetical protein